MAEARRLRVDVLTLFPEVFGPFLGSSILGIAREKGILEVHCHDIRAWSRDKHRRVDDRPYGGGPGMVLRPEPVVEATEAVQAMEAEPGELILLTPQGERYTQAIARELAARKRLVMICGHYEGVDERVRLLLKPREISVGDYVLTGGEPAAVAIVDSVTRLLPGVLGDPESGAADSFQSGLLQGPQYTRPAEYRGLGVPEVLKGGDHQAVAAWRAAEARRRTAERRPDLGARTGGSPGDRATSGGEEGASPPETR
ncbi:MAG: tRNA (guanosine(37)-N1)-methyltransferase TrmD [Planctomycetales bacterium]|nr:tRNA (guanosine(37)-N1)-methyltransferase TrmD [Planctomycetales bacterium]